MWMDLGDWIKRCPQWGVQDQGKVAGNALEECGVSMEELWRQWASQQKSQLSLCAYKLPPIQWLIMAPWLAADVASDAPTWLKKELDTVLELQADIDTTDRAIQCVKSTIEKQHISSNTMVALASLECTHDHLMNKVEALYVSMNVSEKFPELKDIDLNFIWMLLLACDLKINIHKQAIGSFFEWDKLDWAVGGAQKMLSNMFLSHKQYLFISVQEQKLHQHTWKAIAKWQPALMATIQKYNMYCTQLQDLHDTSWFIPLFKPLLTKFNELWNHESLMEDVWISPAVGHIPCWMDNKSVHDGIQVMLRCDYCLEEWRRLGMEADNLCCWYGFELTAVELVLCISQSKSLHVTTITTNGIPDEIFFLPLQHHHKQLLMLSL